MDIVSYSMLEPKLLWDIRLGLIQEGVLEEGADFSFLPPLILSASHSLQQWLDPA